MQDYRPRVRDGRHAARLSRFDRNQLPDAASYYEKRLGLKPGTNGWAQARCPFHKDRTPSFSVNLTTGGYYCHGCGAKGGDVLAFHQQLTGLEFKHAARDLGAWAVQP